MSTQAHARTRAAGTRRRPSKAQRQRRRKIVRRRLMLLAFAVVASLVLLAVVVRPFADKAVQEISLPLRHEDIIRQQAADKGLDASLLAGVIYTESRFRDQTSHAGARGLMQITPATANYIAQKSGGTRFEQGDLATPQINISYGSWYLRYLLDRYDGNVVLALCAYNGGEGNVDKWLQEAHVADTAFTLDRVPFAETREYVRRVLDARKDYREQYPRELGL
jgi:soluble lytic murein transglycosylase